MLPALHSKDMYCTPTERGRVRMDEFDARHGIVRGTRDLVMAEVRKVLKRAKRRRQKKVTLPTMAFMEKVVGEEE